MKQVYKPIREYMSYDNSYNTNTFKYINPINTFYHLTINMLYTQFS